MNVALRRPGMTVEDFLDWENRQDARWEFDGDAPVAMVGGTVAHSLTVTNLVLALGRRLQPPCRVHVEGVKLRLARGVRYPDAMVVCGPLHPKATEISDPVVVFEVLSPGTFRTDRPAPSRTDRIDKNREYAAHASILRYILLEQDAIAAEVYARDGERWVRSTLTGDDVLALPEIGIELPLAEAYAGLDPNPAPG